MAEYEDITGDFFLGMFTTSKYMAVLYNGQGDPLWGANRKNHKYDLLLDALCKNSIFTYFHIPECKCLDDLHLRGYEGAYNDKRMLPELEELCKRRFNTNMYARYPSRNIAERNYTTNSFVLKYPLSYMGLIRISADLFLGIISFTAFFQELVQINELPVLITDIYDIVTGANTKFLEFNTPEKNSGIIGTGISDVLEWNSETEKARPSLFNDVPVVSEWFFPAAANKLVVEDNGHAETEVCANGLLWSNKSSMELSFIKCPTELDTGKGIFQIDIAFVSRDGTYPSISINTGQYIKEDTPDLYGYSLTYTIGDSMLNIKKEQIRVVAIPVSKADNAVATTLSFRRNGALFHVLINGKIAGSWYDNFKLDNKKGNNIFIYSRPGQIIELSSIVIKHDQAVISEDQKRTLSATIKTTSGLRLFNVNKSHRVIDSFSVVLYQFEDVTELHRNITTLKEERDRLRKRLQYSEQSFAGESTLIRKIRDRLPIISKTNLSVLIEGETGTGKDVLARQIHLMSDRRKEPFVKTDCSAIPEQLIESELFGHEKGAFTGALSARAGRFEQANGGTLFLDEIANIPFSVQGKLLNVLQDKVVKRIGSNRDIALDVRIIAASNQLLTKLIANGKFRSDLYFRLNQMNMVLPALRDRKEDIPLLAEIFIAESAASYGRQAISIAPEALARLMKYEWPGNIRELKNCINRAILFAVGNIIKESDFEIQYSEKSTHKSNRGGYRRKTSVDKESLGAVVADTVGNISLCAKRLGISRVKIYQLVHKYGIDINRYRS